MNNVLDLNNFVIDSETLGKIPIPRNIVYGNPESDPRSLVDSLPEAGGVIVLTPGEYYNFGLGSRDKNCLVIVGESDNSGNFPTIYGPIYSGTRPGSVVYLGNMNIDGQGLYQTGIKTQKDYRETLWPCLMITENVRLFDFISNGFWPSAISYLEMYNTELARCGRGNFEHNIYIADECDTVIVRDSYFHSSQGSHAFKNKSRRLLVSNSRFDTTSRWEEYLFSPGLDVGDRFFSTTLLDSVSTCEHTLTGCTFNFWRRDRTGNYLFEAQRRKTGSYGCDDPPYRVDGDVRTYLPPQEQVSATRDMGVTYPEPIRDGVFWDNTFWDSAKEAGGLGRLISRFWDNTFRIVFKENQQSEIYGISNKGSFPVVDNGPTGFYDYPIPDRWFDRSTFLVHPNNRFIGFNSGEEIIAADKSNSPLVPNNRKGQRSLNPVVRFVDESVNWVDSVRPYNGFSIWKYRVQTDRNVMLMRERLGYVKQYRL